MAFQSSSLSYSSSVDDLSKTPAKASDIFGSQLRTPEIERTHLRFLYFIKSNPKTLRLKAVMESPAQETKGNKPKVEEVSDHFKELRHRFLGFKKDIYLSNLERYQRAF